MTIPNLIEIKALSTFLEQGSSLAFQEDFRKVLSEQHQFSMKSSLNVMTQQNWR